MSGNLWEWTSSLKASYPYNKIDRREEEAGYRTDIQHSLRGGSFDNVLYFMQSTDRYGSYPSNDLTNNGSRCTRDIE